MEEKRFGVKTHLIQELRRFQSSLKHRRITMPFKASANTFVNDSPIIVKREIQAENGRLSIIPSIFQLAVRPPKQTLESLSETAVRLMMDVGLYITIIFDSEGEKNRFATAMANLNDSSSSEEEKESP